MRLSWNGLQTVGFIGLAFAVVVHAADSPAIQKAREATQRRVAEIESGKLVSAESCSTVMPFTKNLPATTAPRGRGGKAIDPAMFVKATPATENRVAELESGSPAALGGCQTRIQPSKLAPEELALVREAVAKRVAEIEGSQTKAPAAGLHTVDPAALHKAGELTAKRVAELEWQGRIIRPEFIADRAALEKARAACAERITQIDFPKPIKPQYVADSAAIERARKATLNRLEEIDFKPQPVLSVNPALIQQARKAVEQRVEELDFRSQLVPPVNPGLHQEARKATQERVAQIDPLVTTAIPKPVSAATAEQIQKAGRQAEQAVMKLEGAPKPATKPLIQDTEKIKREEKKRVEKRVKEELKVQAPAAAPKAAEKKQPAAPQEKKKTPERAVSPQRAAPAKEVTPPVIKPAVPEAPIKSEVKEQPKPVTKPPKQPPAKPAAEKAKVTPAKETEAQKRQAAEKAARVQAAQKPPGTAQPPASTEIAPTLGLEVPPPPISPEKQKKLNELLEKYMADKITPEEYHRERARILSEP